jgi:hypothetical protein
MHFLPNPILFAALPAASAIPANLLTERKTITAAGNQTHYNAWICNADQSSCAVSNAPFHQCQSATSDTYPILNVSSNAECTAWQEKGCPKKSKQQVSYIGLAQTYDVTTDAHAKKLGTTTIGSFRCELLKCEDWGP